MPEFTQEQLDQMLADAKKGLFTEEELTRRVTAEVDRRVESGIQKGLETQKTKWEEEFKKTANLTAEELAKKKLEEQMASISTKEQDIKRRANLLDAKDMLSEAGIPKEHYEKFINILVSDDEETTKGNVTNFVQMFNSTKTDIETKVKAEISKVPPPKGGKDNPVSKADFDKMSYAQKLAFKAEHAELYKEFMK